MNSQAGVTALRELAEQSYATGQYEKALVLFQQVVELDPKCEIAFRGLGFTLHALNRNKEALCAFDTALDLKPQDVHSHVGMGLSHGALGEDNLAIRALEYSLTIDNHNDFARHALLIACRRHTLELLEQGNIEAARVRIERALELDAEGVETIEVALEYYRKVMDYEGAKRWIRRLETSVPHLPELKDWKREFGLGYEAEIGDFRQIYEPE